MKQTLNRNKSAGFAIVEVGLGVIVVGILIAVGVIFWQRSHSSTTANTETTASTSTPAVQPAPVGTTASIDQITAQDAQAESGVDSSADANVEQDATSVNGAISNIGGAYNESNL